MLKTYIIKSIADFHVSSLIDVFDLQFFRYQPTTFLLDDSQIFIKLFGDSIIFWQMAILSGLFSI